ncbi:MAG TPA: DMT family transporter [Bryobacteraceae bacterium]|nr:DMT family transporter [Bryobacteraceae bacterium]
MNRPAVLYALILAMVAFWSGNYVAGKIALREFPALLLAGLRISTAGILIVPVWMLRRKLTVSTPGAWVRLLLLGLFGVTLNQVFFVVGLSRTSVFHSALIIGLGPLLVLILACMRGLEKMTARKMAGMLIALAGLVLLKAFEPSMAGGPTWLGDCIVFLAALFFAMFTVFGKETSEQFDSVTVNTVAYVGGGLTMLPVTIWEASRHSLAHISAAAWAGVIYMAMFSSVIAYLIYYYALTRIAASRVSAFSYLQPVFALGLGAAILNERVGMPEIAGGLVILSGVYLAERG